MGPANLPTRKERRHARRVGGVRPGSELGIDNKPLRHGDRDDLVEGVRHIK